MKKIETTCRQAGNRKEDLMDARWVHLFQNVILSFQLARLEGGAIQLELAEHRAGV